MYDVLIFSSANPEAAARTLSSLVEGVVDGMVGRVTVMSAETSPELLALGDASGCRVEAGVPADKLHARISASVGTEHVLSFKAGALMPAGWPQLMKNEMMVRGKPGTAVALLFEPPKLLERVKLILSQMLKGRFPLDHGALVPREQLLHTGFDGLTVKVYGPVHMSKVVTDRVG
jgi:hypothetical protein